MIGYYEALSSLARKTNSGYTVVGDENGDVLTWYSDTVPQPTDSEVNAEIALMEEQAEAKAQLRTSVINKIATNLTSEEKLWLEENL
jgi:hypothetical protein